MTRKYFITLHSYVGAHPNLLDWLLLDLPGKANTTRGLKRPPPFLLGSAVSFPVCSPLWGSSGSGFEVVRAVFELCADDVADFEPSSGLVAPLPPLPFVSEDFLRLFMTPLLLLPPLLLFTFLPLCDDIFCFFSSIFHKKFSRRRLFFFFICCWMLAWEVSPGKAWSKKRLG